MAILVSPGVSVTVTDESQYGPAGPGTVPLIVIAGKEYGSGSSRDWAAKGPNLLGVRAAIAESFERIHRSNLLMMGILPLQFMPGESAESLGLTGRERFTVLGLDRLQPRSIVEVVATKSGDGDAPVDETVRFAAIVRPFRSVEPPGP